MTVSISSARLAWLLLLVIPTVFAVTTHAQSASRTKRPPANATPQRDAAFDKAVRVGDEARTAGQLDQAVESYKNALRIRPRWADGWWYVGAIHYDKDQYVPAREAFNNLVALEPKRGPAWAMLGLCEFQTRNYEQAAVSLERGRSLGLNGNQELDSVVRYHLALLSIRFGKFELSYELLRGFVPEGNNSPKIIEAFGLTLLRLPFLPREVPSDKREAILLAGQAGVSMAGMRTEDARRAFDSLVTRYPNDANAHYSFGVFIRSQDAETSLKELQRALELDPLHHAAMVQLAFEYLKRKEFEKALPLAEKSVQLAPRLYAARNVLGRVLIELGQTARAIKELEEGVRLAPDSPEMHFALARAYTRAGRAEEAKREQEIFKRLQAEYDAKRTPGSNSESNPDKP